MLHWEALKGFNGTSENTLVYTYFYFQKRIESGTGNWAWNEDNARHYAVPKLWVKNSSSAGFDLGYIACEERKNSFVNYDQSFSALSFPKVRSSLPTYYLYNPSIIAYGQTGSYNNLYIQGGGTLNLDFGSTITAHSKSSIKFYSMGSYTNYFSFNYDTEYFIPTGKHIGFSLATNTATDNPTQSTKLLYIQDTDTTAALVNINSSRVFCNIPVHADFFNAISDRRSKKDITLLDQSLLKVVNSVPVYSFKYNKDNKPSIGIMAQDLEEINLNGFNLVANKNATGEGFDFMHIHENKLVYVLWKAVQELSQEVTDLKAQLNK